MNTPTIYFHEGTLLLDHWEVKTTPPYFLWDSRSQTWRALACYYIKILTDKKELVH